MTDSAQVVSRHLALLLMDPPFESSRMVVALRLIAATLQAGHKVSVFAYEGAVALTQEGQTEHPNPVHGTPADGEDHLLPSALVEQLSKLAAEHAGQLDWVNCGYCMDERGSQPLVPLTRRGGPADFKKMIEGADQVIVIATRGE